MSYSPEERTKALYYYFGWQGGTVHQLARETGLSVSQILYDDLGNLTGISPGGNAIHTKDTDTRNKVGAFHKGDVQFWHEVIKGFYVGGPLV